MAALEPTVRCAFVAEESDAGRIDRAIARRLNCSIQEAKRLCDRGLVRIGHARAKKGDFIRLGQPVTVISTPHQESTSDAVDILLIHDEFLVINKPAGIHSHSLRDDDHSTLSARITNAYRECSEASPNPREGGLVQRLDIGTSGVILAARTRTAWHALRELFSRHAVDKVYHALTFGQPLAQSCDLAIAQRGSRAVTALAHTNDGLPAHSVFSVVERLGAYNWVKCETQTGRRHQVRVHLAALGAPLVGDTLYGGPSEILAKATKTPIAWPFLHASTIRFIYKDQPFTIQANLPSDRLAVLDALRH